MDEYVLNNGLVIREGSTVTLCDDFNASGGGWVYICGNMTDYESKTVVIKSIKRLSVNRVTFKIVCDDSMLDYAGEFIIAADGNQVANVPQEDHYNNLKNKDDQF